MRVSPEDGEIYFDIISWYELQFVCKYLQAFDANRFRDFTGEDDDFHPDAIENLDGPTCFNVLSKHVNVGEDVLSFILFDNFVKFTYHQFIPFGLSELLTNFVVAAVLELPAFKNFIVDFMIKTSSDFSTRAISSVVASQDQMRISQEILRLSNDETFATRFDRMRHWEDSDHPFVVFNQSRVSSSAVKSGGLNIISLNPRLIDDNMNATMKETLMLNGFNFDFDYRKISRENALALLSITLGVEDYHDPQPEYVLTFDNIMKMISVQLRVKYNIPSIIMGETGCGKTSLIRYLCEFLTVPLFQLDVHGGITDEYIIEWMKDPIRQALDNEDEDVYIFFDEINTCNSMALFKNIVCDGFMNGFKLPRNLKFIAACNPYRLIDEADQERERIGLVFEHHQSNEIIPDPLAKLVYRVHPLPETIIEYVWDFGSLPADVEKLYIHSLLNKKFKVRRRTKHFRKSFVSFFTEMIVVSHKFMRETGFTTSLRDVNRCVTLLNWFQESFHNRAKFGERVPSDVEILRRSFVLALTHCYHSRLNEKRRAYREAITRACNRTPPFALRLNPGDFFKIYYREQRYYAEQMITGKGIALNEALCENIFMILVCVLNRIPIFVVGKPGSSKSLSVELIGSNLNGKTSDKPFFQEYPAVEIFSYQCSPLSTSQGIEQTFHHAIRYQANASNTIVVVLLDEVGLAEQSAHLPLKVLHKLLEHPEVAVVGISNWGLDRAKMNRAIHLTRPEPSVEDLKLTAMGIISSQHLQASLQSLAEAYYTIYHNQTKADFFGLRDYYHLIKYLMRNLDHTLTPELLDSALQRNFGGIPSEMEMIYDEFFSRVGLPRKRRTEDEKASNVVDIIQSNLDDRDARHLMLLTQNDAALQLLFDQEILDHENTVILFGSDFPADHSDLYVCLNIQTIKSCMAKGRTVVLIHSENLYESLYDMLNQHYIEYQGQRYVRLALGTTSKLCPIHNAFRTIVIVDTNEAYTKLAPPLLNRFEKRIFVRKHLLNEVQQHVRDQVEDWVSNFFSAVNSVRGSKFKLSDIFVGFHNDTISSLVLSLPIPYREDGTPDESLLVAMCIDKLLWLATPEAVVLASRSTNSDWENNYFHDQVHENLPSFLNYALLENTEKLSWGDEHGIRAVIATFSPMSDYSSEIYKFLPSLSQPKENVFEIEQAEITETVIGLQEQLNVLRDQRAEEQGEAFTDEATEDEQKIIDQISEAQEKLEEIVVKQQEQEKEVVEEPVVEEDDYRIPVALKLHDFSSEVEFVSEIQKFFSIESQGVMLVLCDPEAASYQRITHARYICQKERSDYYRNPEIEVKYKKHLVFLLHLNRASEDSYTFDFDKSWSYTLVDDIRPSPFANTPDTIDLLQGSEIEFLTNELSPTLVRTFHMCLARLIYPFERTSDDIQEQIKMLSELLFDEDFMGPLTERMRRLMEDLIKEKSSASDVSWQEDVAKDVNAIAVAGTFRSALFNNVSRTVTSCFTQILCSIDRNSNLRLYWKSNGDIKDLWLSIFEDPSLCYLALFQGESSRYDVITDGIQGPFRCDFPFSYVFINAIESMRSEVYQIAGTITDSISRLGRATFGNLFDRIVLPNQLDAYIHDFILMKATITQIDEEAKLSITSSVITKEIKEIDPPLTIPKIHASYWANENRLQHIFSLLDLFPELTAQFLELVRNLQNQDFSLVDLDFSLINLVLDLLTSAMNDNDKSVEWVINIARAQTSLQSLLGIDSTVPEWIKWKKILFLRYFIREVSVPLNISSELSQEFANVIKEGSFLEKATFDNMLSILQRIISDSNRSQVSLKQCSLITELYIGEFCLESPDSFDLVEDQLLDDLFVSITSRTHPAFGPEGIVATIPLLNLLINTLQMSDSIKCDHLRNHLESKLKEDIFSDTATLWVQCTEDLELKRDFLLTFDEQILSVAEAISTIDPVTSFNKELNQTDFLEKLTSVGRLRFFLSRLAYSAMDSFNNGTDIPPQWCEIANRILTIKNEASELGTLSAKLFFLRIIYKARGPTYSQEIMHSEYITGQLTWLEEWKNDTRVKQFLRKRHLIQQDPFQLYDGYNEMKKAVRDAVDGNSETLSALASAEPAKKGLLLMAIFMEVTMLYTVEPATEAAGRVMQILDPIGFSDVDLGVFRNFCFNDTNIPCFTVTPDSESPQVMLLTCIVHSIAVTMIHPRHEFFNYLRTNPMQLDQSYVLTMPKDERLELMRVLGGGWYECPNGHTYYVSECGRPTQEYECPSCGAKIGGLDHNLEQSNKESVREDQTAPGYLLQSSNEDINLFNSERELPATSIRIIRIIMHALLTAGALADRIFETQSKTFAKFEGDNVAEFFAEHLESNWSFLLRLFHKNEDETAVVFHHILESLSSTSAVGVPITKERRQEIENLFHEEAVAPFVDNMDDTIANFFRLYDDDAGSLLAELRETIILDEGENEDLETRLHNLWRHRQPMTIEHFLSRFNWKPEYKEEHPLLQVILSQENEVHSLQYIYHAVEFYNLLVQKFDKRIDRKYARETTIAEILNDLPADEKRRWETAYSGFEKAWNIMWPHVKHEEVTCEEIPSDWKNQLMDKQVRLVFCLADDQDEGLCPLSLLTSMVDKHNQLFDIIKDRLYEQYDYVIPARMMKEFHCIQYSLEEIIPFLQRQFDQDLKYGKGSTISYDFARIEQYIIDNFLAGKPQINLNLKRFSFANETRKTGVLSSLNQKIEQINLTEDLKEKILQDMSSLAHIHEVMRILEVTIGFLSATGGTNIKISGEEYVDNYIKETLLLSGSVNLGNTIEKQIRLCHLVALWEFLEEQLSSDPFDNVVPKYRIDLEPEMEEDLRNCIKDIDIPTVCAVLKNLLLNQMNAEHNSASIPISSFIMYSTTPEDTYLYQLSWFSNFPESMETKHMLETYRFLAEFE
eukprot:TRINITY_DN2328_c0_g2_i1.p1 TRINITY_DN2328_c0_g2~~TRINITY_DN2328_c0_g2_i1.p1  ORF type:complete len:3185 (-),score=755.13 TRINITY_DN2328_c0_g2_i1:18-8699(-)